MSTAWSEARTTTRSTTSRAGRLEERIYRLRCVEGWSMVIPWVGLSAREVLAAVEPQVGGEVRGLRDARRPEEMPGQRGVARLALRRGAAARRGDAPADDPRGRPLRRGRCRTRTARRSGSSCRGSTASSGSSRSCASRSTERAAADHLEQAGAERVRLLLQREPRGRPPALEPGDRARHRRGGCSRTRRRQMFNGYADEVASLYAGMDLREILPMRGGRCRQR